jgi:copper chaperone NosL
MMMRSTNAVVLVSLGVLGLTVACGQREMTPAALDTAKERCARCGMGVSDVKFAAQIVAPGEAPRFYDDIGCFANDVKEKTHPSGAVAFVADHRTGEWVRAASAVYTRVPSLATPMNSHLIAHASAESRGQDAEARDGELVTHKQVFGAGSVPGRPSQ